MLAWTKQVKCRGQSEQPIDIRVVTKSCNIKLINEVTWINVNHSSSTALERSVINNWGGGLKPELQVHNLTLSFCSGSQHLVSCSISRGESLTSQ